MGKYTDTAPRVVATSDPTREERRSCPGAAADEPSETPLTFTDVRWFDELGSTNTWLLEAAASGSPEGTVVVADRQSAGRGRLGRTWTSTAGSGLLTSILFRPALAPGELFSVAALVALAALDAAESVAGVRGRREVAERPRGRRRKARRDAFRDERRHLRPAGGGRRHRDQRQLADARTRGRRAASDVPRGRERPGRPIARRCWRRCWTRSRRDVPLIDDAAGRASLVRDLARAHGDDRPERPRRAGGGELHRHRHCARRAGRLVVETEGGPRTVSAGDVVHLR